MIPYGLEKQNVDGISQCSQSLLLPFSSSFLALSMTLPTSIRTLLKRCRADISGTVSPFFSISFKVIWSLYIQYAIKTMTRRRIPPTTQPTMTAVVFLSSSLLILVAASPSPVRRIRSCSMEIRTTASRAVPSPPTTYLYNSDCKTSKRLIYSGTFQKSLAIGNGSAYAGWKGKSSKNSSEFNTCVLANNPPAAAHAFCASILPNHFRKSRAAS